ncbi:hypothetical protein GIB67_035145 [Kingdonia uniflora]|uniref:Uncharacterized protein n=1 Tax=Kingdonia uniflora TaxID=39325 RepID=A0A7J7LDQ2_9MAGN|nr:hypothetical protein GIB67_035145 [Kingdonia uniflora]
MEIKIRRENSETDKSDNPDSRLEKESREVVKSGVIKEISGIYGIKEQCSRIRGETAVGYGGFLDGWDGMVWPSIAREAGAFRRSSSLSRASGTWRPRRIYRRVTKKGYRARVVMDIYRVFPPAVWVEMATGPLLIGTKYDEVPINCCNRCYKIGHREVVCTVIVEEDTAEATGRGVIIPGRYQTTGQKETPDGMERTITEEIKGDMREQYGDGIQGGLRAEDFSREGSGHPVSASFPAMDLGMRGGDTTLPWAGGERGVDTLDGLLGREHMEHLVVEEEEELLAFQTNRGGFSGGGWGDNQMWVQGIPGADRGSGAGFEGLGEGDERDPLILIHNSSREFLFGTRVVV